MLLVNKELQVDEIIYGEGSDEVLKVGLKSKGEGRRDFAVVYVPPKTCSWVADEYEKIIDDTRKCLQRLIVKSRNITVMEDFNY